MAGISDVYTGWKPEPHDIRDHGPDSAEVKALFSKKASKAAKYVKASKPPSKVDLRQWCPTPQLQGTFNTCAAHVVSALVEYFERRVFGKSISPSRRFLFRVAKNLAAARGEADQGVYIRQAMGALKMIGAPPEKFFPYPDVTAADAAASFDEEPTAFCYALAADYRAVTYYRLDTRNGDGNLVKSPADLLTLLKEQLAANIPMSLGFPLYAGAVKDSLKAGELAYPSKADTKVGSHAITVVGYDDERGFPDGADPKNEKGALLILNSWGEKWGEGGFGWLSYRYVLENTVSDVWTLLQAEWTDCGQFQFAM